MMCAWFALCTNEATVELAHPVLGWVPACDRCADRDASWGVAHTPRTKRPIKATS